MISGFINVLKPPGMTSHDIVSFIRRTYGLKRVGHAGTLDPAAAGVLPVALGHATRLIEYTTDADKSYRAELTLGYATDSGDSTGEIICQSDFEPPSSTKICQVLNSFIGQNEQIPPMYSAVKIAGKKLYELARSGVTVERQPRSIFIHDLSLIHAAPETILFDVTCSKGTYIRTLCMDIGDKLNIPAVMSFLVRTRVGSFILADSFTIEEIAEQPESVLLPADTALTHIPRLSLTVSQAQAFRYGQSIPYSGIDQPLLRIYDDRHLFVGIGQLLSNSLAPVKVMSFA